MDLIKKYEDSTDSEVLEFVKGVLNVEDIARMGYVIMNYDEISYDKITTNGYLDETGQASPMIRISKKIDGTYYVIGAVNSSKKKRSYVVAAYISKEKEQ